MVDQGAACLLGLVIGLTACASSQGSALYRREIGNASGPDAMSRSMRIVNRYQYEVASSESARSIRIETSWRKRRPFADELALGIAEAESRLIITARNRGPTRVGQEDEGVLYSLHLTIENRVRQADSADWTELVNTKMFEAYGDEITSEFRKELSNIGVRTFE